MTELDYFTNNWHNIGYNQAEQVHEFVITAKAQLCRGTFTVMWA